jgi:hypothetical protein
LYVADEVFFSGTAAEITPVRSVDKIPIGNGGRGEITERIQTVFFDITSGERPAPGPWLTYVREQDARAAERESARATENGRGAAVKKSAGSQTAPTMETELVARAAR